MTERDDDEIFPSSWLPWLAVFTPFIVGTIFGIFVYQTDKIDKQREQEPPFYFTGAVKDETYSSETNTRMFSVESSYGLKIFEYDDSPLAQKLDTSMSRGDRVRVEVRPWQERLPDQPNHYYINPHQVLDINGKAPSL